MRILLVDDFKMIRQGLRALLEREPDFQVVGEADNGRSAVAMIAELSPDVVVMDLLLPDLNGIDATRQALAVNPKVKVVGLTANASDRHCAEMLRAGASAFVMKDDAFDDLANAIRTVMLGKVYLSPPVASIVLSQAAQEAGGPSPAYEALSPREREVIQLIAEGMATKEIARHLNLSVKTIETHRRNLMEKLGIDSVAELTRYAIREGVTPL